ncbi:Polysulfide reductase NrfD [Alkalidesulfovibrio alkalitolerans DSM 16529]|jgi:molybdopterin-containing oxidoreductase family membrane subunit|uniref:Polysulfide reductase NrfD n=1 Tax=Alkalidesulfovibrio alkalitolerans DSM 16529 TaxID=1121439 RepID=S7T747_9BACT|nr:NrfD/PsrC family molybdoenzyme membrane anchor subunit [Alkalidesulfovibrio alkalitolerans]EPR32285.1 Polysulfide reductase NrfD [Alkalidesulfovibrio alkalitolerans DSM 16529]
MNRSGIGVLWLAALGVALAFGLYSALTVIIGGVGVYNANDVTFWTLPMAGYLFFGLTAAGLTFLSSLPTVFGLKRYYPIAKRASLLAGATLVTGLMCKGLDLGPWTTLLNMVNIFLSPNLTSPIWWMGMLYTFYLVLVVSKFYIINKGEWHTQGAYSAALGALLLALTSFTALGVVFGVVEARLAFFGQFVSLYFLVTAIASGLAAIILASMIHCMRCKVADSGHESLMDELGKILGWTLAACLFVLLLRTKISFLTTEPEFLGFQYLAATPLFQIELWIGIVIPMLMMARKSLRLSMSAKAVASLMVLVGMFASRMELLLAGQIAPIGQMAENRPPFVSYWPSIYEIGTVLLALALTLLIYTFAVRYLNLEAAPE